jgi:hypothetical protein
MRQRSGNNSLGGDNYEHVTLLPTWVIKLIIIKKNSLGGEIFGVKTKWRAKKDPT